jgi:hypothetical protein
MESFIAPVGGNVTARITSGNADFQVAGMVSTVVDYGCASRPP